MNAARLNSDRAVLRLFAAEDLSPAVRGYLRFHTRRYLHLARTAVEAREHVAPGRAAAVLDIGTFLQTQVLRACLPGDTIHTHSHPSVAHWGGWGATQDGALHLSFDLNDAQRRERWPAAGPFDLVVMAEVIEHLHTAPALVLGCIASWMQPGGQLIVQTPNAVALDKRVKLLAGRHPYDAIKEDDTQAAHFREYTIEELTAAAALAGFSPRAYSIRNYFGINGVRRRAWKEATAALPESLRDGITAVFRLDSAAQRH